MYRRERYFDKNDRPNNMYGQEKENRSKEKWDDDEEITLVVDNKEIKKQAKPETSQ